MYYIELTGTPGAGKTFITQELEKTHTDIRAIYEANGKFVRYITVVKKLAYLFSFIYSLLRFEYNRELKNIFPNITLRQLFAFHLLTRKINKIPIDILMIIDQGFFQIFYSVNYDVDFEELHKEFDAYLDIVMNAINQKELIVYLKLIDIDQNLQQLTNRTYKKTNLSNIYRNKIELKTKLQDANIFFRRMARYANKHRNIAVIKTKHELEEYLIKRNR